MTYCIIMCFKHTVRIQAHTFSIRVVTNIVVASAFEFSIQGWGKSGLRDDGSANHWLLRVNVCRFEFIVATYHHNERSLAVMASCVYGIASEDAFFLSIPNLG